MCSTNDGWECVARRDDITEQTPLSSDSGDNGIGLYEVNGQLCAMEDTCPHGAALLSRGFVHDGKVKCPLHGAVFDIRTGKCLEGPAERNLETYQVQVKGDDVYIRIQPDAPSPSSAPPLPLENSLPNS